MQKGLISIIVPIFNTSAYLKLCIDSIIAQSFQNYELILVDDGSTDDSRMICDEYHGKDNRIRVFHTSNHGVSHARNLGINAAEGEYIAFIDSDDFIDVNYLESYIQHKEYDCVIGNYQTYPIEHKTIHKEMTFNTNDNDLTPLCKYVAKIDGTSCCKLYQHDIIKKHNIRFNEKMRFSEDTDFCLHYFRYIKTIKIISNIGYHYKVDANNQVERKYNLSKDEIDHNLSILLDDYQKLEKKWNSPINHSNFRIGVACYPIENIYLQQSDEEYYELYNKFFYHADKEAFYKDPICSPYVRTITAIKSDYLNRERENGKQLMRDFRSLYGKKIDEIIYPYPLYKTYAKLISHHCFFIADIFFRLYSMMKV